MISKKSDAYRKVIETLLEKDMIKTIQFNMGVWSGDG